MALLVVAFTEVAMMLIFLAMALVAVIAVEVFVDIVQLTSKRRKRQQAKRAKETNRAIDKRLHPVLHTCQIVVPNYAPKD